MVNLQKALLGTSLLASGRRLDCERSQWFSLTVSYPPTNLSIPSIPVGKDTALSWMGCTLSNVTDPVSLYLIKGDTHDSDPPGTGFVAWISTSLKIRDSFDWNVTLDPFSSMPSYPSNVLWRGPAPEPEQRLQPNEPYKFALTDGLRTLIRSSEYSFNITDISKPPTSTSPTSGSTTSISPPSKTSGATAKARYWVEGQIGIRIGVLVLLNFWLL